MSKNTRALALLFSANIISGFSTGITIFAIPWYLVSSMGEENGNFLNTVTMGTVTFLTLFWGMYVGTLIDRLNRKRIFQILNLVDGLLLLSVVLITWNLDSMPFPFLALITLSTLFTFNVHYPNLYAMLQEMFDPGLYARVNSGIELQGQVTNFLGMLVGGILIAGTNAISWCPEWLSVQPWRMSEIFLMDGVTYLISFLLISLIPYTPNAARLARKDGSVIRRIRLGFEYLKENRPLLVFGIASYVVFFTMLVMVQVALPIYISDVMGLGKAEGGLTFTALEAFYCAGAIAAGLLGLSLSKHLTTGNLLRGIIGLMLICGALYLLWAFTNVPNLFIWSGLALGLSNAGIRILRVTYLVRIVPNHMIGRVNSFFQIANVLMRCGMIAVIALPFFSAQGNGGNIVYAILLMGILVLASMLILMFKFSTFGKSAATQK